MAVYAAIMGAAPSDTTPVPTRWGCFGIHPWQDPTTLAADPAVTDDEVSEVLVVAPTAGPAAGAAERAAAARVAGSAIAAVRPGLSVRVESHPVSLGVLVRAFELVAEVSPRATAVHAGLSVVLDTIAWGAWLPSVARLEDPPPTLGQHVQSLLARGAGFFAMKGAPGWVAKLPVQQVDPARRLSRGAGPGSGPGAELAAHAFGELPEPAIATLFAMGLATRPTRRAPLGDAATVWGSPDACEFVVAPTSPLVLGAPVGSCRSCGEPVWGESCPFCRSAVRPVTGTVTTPDLGATR